MAKLSIFQKIKQWLGIGGAKVELVNMPKSITKNDKTVSGQLRVTTKSDQNVKSIEYTVEERWTSKGSGESKTKEFELGKKVYNQEFTIKPGQEKTIDFEIPFQFIKTNEDKLKEKGGALGALGSASAFLKGHSSKYYVKVTADVVGAALDPNDSYEIEIAK